MFRWGYGIEAAPELLVGDLGPEPGSVISVGSALDWLLALLGCVL